MGGMDRTRTMHRAVWGRGSLHAGAGGLGSVVSGTRMGDRLIAAVKPACTNLACPDASALLSDADLETLQRKVQGATQERMLREMAEALEVITAERPLILTLEDLHWSDYATLELLSTLARRQERARLLVLSTYRPVDVIIREHPLEGHEAGAGAPPAL